jgi:hypothetical protein
MPGAPTPNLGLTVPTVGGDNNQWGAEINGDLAIIDQLGIVLTIPQGGTFVATQGLTPEVVYRVATGPGNVNASLSATTIGKIITLKKVDAGAGSVVVIGSIDGQASYLLTNQFQYVRVQYNGATYDVIGNN